MVGRISINKDSTMTKKFIYKVRYYIVTYAIRILNISGTEAYV